MNIKSIILSVLLSLFFLQSFAQRNPRTARDRGEKFFFNQSYDKALPYLLKYQEAKPKDDENRLRIAICYFQTNRLDRAKAYLELLESRKKPMDDVFYYLALTYHAQHKFQKAIDYYKIFLSARKIPLELKEEVKDNIIRCDKGKKMAYKPKMALIENMGDHVNTSFDDFAPTMSKSNPNGLYFSSVREGNVGGLLDRNGRRDSIYGEYRSDIYYTSFQNAKWTLATPLSEEYNSPTHDIAMGFDDLGNTIFFARTESFGTGRIYQASYPTASAAAAMSAPINSDAWEGGLFIYNDSILLFSSERAGGFGGKDLYISLKTATGAWGTPENLGKDINSEYDEDTPFLSKDGKTLYFSSNNLESIGGYDVFKTTYLEKEKRWKELTNLGMPINSAGDETYFKLNDTGLQGFFSSSRVGGYGARDIYTAFFRNYQAPIASSTEAIAFVGDKAKAVKEEDDKPIVAAKTLGEVKEKPDRDVSFTPTKKKDLEVHAFSPIMYGQNDLLMTAASIKELKKVVKLMKAKPELKIQLTGHMDDEDEKNFNLHVSMKNVESIADFIEDNGIDKSRIYLKGCGGSYPLIKNITATGEINSAAKHLNRRVEIQVYNPNNEDVFIKINHGKVSATMEDKAGKDYLKKVEGLSYKIQIKALTKMYSDEVLVEYPDAMIEKAAESQTMRYSLGLYKTFMEAEALMYDLQDAGHKDAFVVPYINGARLTKEEAALFKSKYSDLQRYLNAED